MTEQRMLFNASSNSAGLKNAIHTVVHRLGRHFGFQAFNCDPKTEGQQGREIWVPATIYLASDHLFHLLVQNLMRRDTTDTTQPGLELDKFSRAVNQLHDNIFEGYQDWAKQVGLPERVEEVKFRTKQTESGVLEWEYLLEELALFFLIYTEASAVRHLPEGIWFLFWILRNSRIKINQVSCPAPTDPRSAAAVAAIKGPHGLSERRVQLRIEHQAEIARLRTLAGIRASGECHASGQVDELFRKVASSVSVEGLSVDDSQLLTEMVVYGDRGVFLDMVISPIFRFLTVQVDKLGGDAREVSERIAYDDCNESFCRREVVNHALGELGLKVDGIKGYFNMDPFDALLAIGISSGTEKDAALKLAPGRQMSFGDILKKNPWSADIARDWWAAHVFGKTFVERRTLYTMYRAFYRVFAFHILLFQLLACIAWAHTVFAASTCLLTHAFLSLMTQFAGIMTQRPVRVNKKKAKLHGSVWWSKHVKGFIDWFIINAILWFCMALWLIDKSRRAWGFVASIYFACCVVHAVITQRPGFAVSMNYTIVSWIDRVNHRTCAPTFLGNMLKPLFTRLGASSAREPPQEYMSRSMKVPLSTYISNVVFWCIVLGVKVVFDYFAIVKPLEGPMKYLWHRNWLTPTGVGTLHIHGKDTGIHFFNFDFVICISRALPAFLTTCIDTGIFYSITAAVFGAVKGLVQLNLGVVSNFQELRQNFHKGPGQLWDHCVSRRGSRQITTAIAEACANPAGNQGDAYAQPSGIEPPKDGQLFSQQLELRTQKQAWATRQESGLQRALKGSGGHNVFLTLNDDTVAMWLVFSDTWNTIINELRTVDLISNVERDNLTFIHLGIDDSILVVEGMRPFLMPVFFYAGQVNKAVEVPGINAAQKVALQELRSLMVWLFLQLGVLSRPQADVILAFTPITVPRTSEHRGKRLKFLSEAISLLKTMEDLQKPMTPGGERRREGFALAVRKNLDGLCGFLTVEIDALLLVHKKPPPDVESLKANHSQRMHGQAVKLRRVIEELREGSLKPDVWQERFCGINGHLGLLYSESTDQGRTKAVAAKVIKQLLKMMETSAKGTAPKGEEAQRVLSFFLSSLKNPTLQRPPPVEEMLSFNTLTPHYEEDVIYAMSGRDAAHQLDMDGEAGKGLSDLTTENEDGVSVMTYLRSIYPLDWYNFMERLKEDGKTSDGKKFDRLQGLDPATITEDDFGEGGALYGLQMELLLWASYRGQLLARTVRGIMSYEDAVRMLAILENPKPQDMSPDVYNVMLDDLVASKFTYIVASQVYGLNRSSTQVKGRWLARGLETLMYQYAGLRVAFMDNVTTPEGLTQFSVLIRGQGTTGPSGTDGNTEELYRVLLPRNTETKRGVVLGEGKPENQNSAIIFCFNELMQAIDMNQDNYLAEALKMRNLCSEFTASKVRKYHKEKDMYESIDPADLAAQRAAQKAAKGPIGMRRLRGAPAAAVEVKPLSQEERSAIRQNLIDRPQQVALVGCREWIFSENSGALASFAAATEFTFGTIVQRVMTWPGAVRFHYGHPDLWNRLFVMTRGGVSKATRGFHISEDVFAGYEAFIRGGTVKFREYISVGKGRDMGFDSINSFESKVAGGNGEQVISRDVHRLGTRFDFFRLMAWYHTGCGFFINSYLVMLSIYATVWMVLLLVLSNSEVYQDPTTGLTYSTITGQTASYSANQLVQLGMLSIITYAVELLLETGVVHATASILSQFISGSIAFFIFRSRTSAYYFKQDVLYGGAKYIPTGRGYALKHNSFVKVYSSYARSHLYFAFEMLMLLILLILVSGSSYGSTTWGPWMVVVAIMISPFWFNPGTFSMTRTSEDYEAWKLWMSDVVDSETKTTWYSWNKGELEKPRDEKRTLSHPFWSAVWGVLESLPSVILTLAAVDFLRDTRYDRWATFGVCTGVLYAAVLIFLGVRFYMAKHFMQRSWRLAKIVFFSIGVAAFLVFVLVYIPHSRGQGVKNAVVIGFANFELLALLVQILLYWFPEHPRSRYYVDFSFRLLDYALGSILFLALFFLAFIQIVARVQAALLFNIKFAKSLKRGRLLQGTYIQCYVDRALQAEIKEREARRKAA